MLYRLKRSIIWLKRFRHRRGYGVHSPFAFDFITNVVYERTAYYAYGEIEQPTHSTQKVRAKRRCSKKVARLIFRIANRVQPQQILYLTSDAFVPHYLRAVSTAAKCIDLTPADAMWPARIDFLLIDASNVHDVKRTFQRAADKMDEHSVCVVVGIYRSGEMKRAWKEMLNDTRVGITFDLYDAGVLFFDHSKLKQHYVVNF